MFNKLALVTAVAVISTAASAGGLTFKAGLGYIDPTASKNMGDVNTPDGFSKVEVSGEAALLPSFDYRFGNSPFSAELLLATPSTHTITALFNDGFGNNVRDEFATVKQVPPALTFKYNTPSWHGISANAGLGATVFIPYEAKMIGVPDIKLDVDTKVAPAAQLGVSWSPASSNWGVFADARYAKLKTKVKATDTTDNTTATLGNLEIDPVVYSIGVSHKF